MRRVFRIFPIAATAGLVMASGCGGAGEFLLDAFKTAAKEAIQTATSQAVGNITTQIGTNLLDQIPQLDASAVPGL